METEQRINNEKRATYDSTSHFAVAVRETDGRCPIGETVGKRNIERKLIPVLSCEGGCIRGEIARLQKRRALHGAVTAS
jgi:hypothetical protein